MDSFRFERCLNASIELCDDQPQADVQFGCFAQLVMPLLPVAFVQVVAEALHRVADLGCGQAVKTEMPLRMPESR